MDLLNGKKTHCKTCVYWCIPIIDDKYLNNLLLSVGFIPLSLEGMS